MWKNRKTKRRKLEMREQRVAACERKRMYVRTKKTKKFLFSMRNTQEDFYCILVNLKLGINLRNIIIDLMKVKLIQSLFRDSSL